MELLENIAQEIEIEKVQECKPHPATQSNKERKKNNFIST
jgi:hypothetical protein